MRTQTMDLPGEVVAGGLVAAGLGVLGFLFRTAAGETLRGLRDSMASLQRSVDNLSSKLETVAVQQANHESRISVMEDRQQRD
jgi:hypothetical protein